MAVAMRLKGSCDARWASVASSPSGEGGGYADSGVGRSVAGGTVGAMPYDSVPAGTSAIANAPAGE